jgi:hypothetical protein
MGVYAGSVAAEILRARMDEGRSPRIACLDIDSTLTGPQTLANRVRLGLEALGFVVVFVTSRTEEMIMCSAAFESSCASGFLRPPPKMGYEGGRHVSLAPERVVAAGLLDGDVIAGSSGTRILVRQTDGGYLPDVAYEGGVEPAAWREQVETLLRWVRAEGCAFELASIDRRGAYEGGAADVFPPDFRVQVNFLNVEEKAWFLRRISVARRRDAYGARGVVVTDDSYPEKGRIKVFLTPRGGTKVRAVERLVTALCTVAGVERRLIEMFFAGDSFPDLEMGLFGGLGTTATFLLAGGSRLAGPLVGDGVSEFAGERTGAFRRRLSRSGTPGRYRFRMPLKDGGVRMVVVGDEAFPDTEEVETVAAFVGEMERVKGSD